MPSEQDIKELVAALRQSAPNDGGAALAQICAEAADALERAHARAEAAEANLRKTEAELGAEREHVQQLHDKYHCMCGQPINHSAWEGHAPVPVYDYALEVERERVRAAEARADALEEALKPFADAVQMVDDMSKVGRIRSQHQAIADAVAYGDFRSAHAMFFKHNRALASPHPTAPASPCPHCDAMPGALEPFAREADTWDFDVPDDHVVRVQVCGPGDTENSQFTVGDLRRARAALTQHRKGDGELE